MPPENREGLQGLTRIANGVAADSLRLVAHGLERARLGVWWLVGWLDGGR